MTPPVSTLAELLAEKDILILPGAHDALSARIAVRAGARAVYMTGFGVVGSAFGVPDIGLIGPDQMAERVRAIASAISPVALIADGDNGHGGPANVARLVRAYEQAGAQCIQIEDQISPKRCGHMDDKEVLSRADAQARIRAAVAARSSPSFKILARTDARATHGLDEALARADRFLWAGADLLFVEAPQSEAELRRVAESFPGVPLVANMVEEGKTPLQSPQTLAQIGYRIALYPISALLAATKRLESAYSSILGGHPIVARERSSFAEYNAIVKNQEIADFVRECNQPLDRFSS